MPNLSKEGSPEEEQKLWRSILTEYIRVYFKFQAPSDPACFLQNRLLFICKSFHLSIVQAINRTHALKCRFFPQKMTKNNQIDSLFPLNKGEYTTHMINQKSTKKK